MTGSGDLLTTATPSRLFCRKGLWVLELVKLVPVDRDVFQPRVQRLEGAEAVLQHLKRSSEYPALAAGASHLMRGFRADDERAFDAVDGEWVPGEPPRPEPVQPSSPPPGQANLSDELAELNAELLVLRVEHERMRERVVHLEGRLIANGTAMRDLISVTPTPAVSTPVVSLPPRPEHFASTLLTGHAPRASDAPRPDSVEPRPGSVEPKAGAPGSLHLPSAEQLNQSLQSLGGEQLAVREADGAEFLALTAGPSWASRLIDDEGAEVGVIIADLSATTALGGGLLGLNREEIAAQRSAGTPSRDVLSAMSEVANHLNGALNQTPGNAQLRVKPIESLVVGQLGWTRAPSQALALEVAAGGGRLFLLAR